MTIKMFTEHSPTKCETRRRILEQASISATAVSTSIPSAAQVGIAPNVKEMWDYGFAGHWMRLPGGNLAFVPDSQDVVKRFLVDHKIFKTRLTFITGYDV